MNRREAYNTVEARQTAIEAWWDHHGSVSVERVVEHALGFDQRDAQLIAQYIDEACTAYKNTPKANLRIEGLALIVAVAAELPEGWESLEGHSANYSVYFDETLQVYTDGELVFSHDLPVA